MSENGVILEQDLRNEESPAEDASRDDDSDRESSISGQESEDWSVRFIPREDHREGRTMARRAHRSAH